MFGAGNSADDDGSDAGDAAATRTITVQAAATNQPPVANAGPDQSVNDADGNGTQQVTLDGSGSTDDGSISAYAWKEGGQTIATGQKPAVSLAVGQHTISLTVADNGSPALTASDDVVITVTAGATSSAPPVADAGGPYSGTMNRPVRFDGRGSSPAGSIAAYSWDFGDGQTGT